MDVKRTKVLITCGKFEDVIQLHAKNCLYNILYIIDDDEVFVFNYNTYLTTGIVNNLNTYKHTLGFLCPELPSTALTLLFYILCTPELDKTFSVYLDDCLELTNEFEEDLVTKWIEKNYYKPKQTNDK